MEMISTWKWEKSPEILKAEFELSAKTIIKMKQPDDVHKNVLQSKAWIQNDAKEASVYLGCILRNKNTFYNLNI